MENKTDSDYVFKAYVVNTAAYDAGEREDSGAWLYFPPRAGEVQSLFEKIGLPPDAAPGKYFMDDYVSHVEGMENVLPMYGDIQELSEVAQAVSGLSPEDRDLLAAVQESQHRLTSLSQFKEFPGNSEYFILEGNIHSKTDLGWRYITDHMDTALPKELRDAIDPVPFGRYAMEDEQGCFTSRGYLSLSGDEWQHEHAAERTQRAAEKKPSIRERLEDARRKCADRKPPEAKRPVRDAPEHGSL